MSVLVGAAAAAASVHVTVGGSPDLIVTSVQWSVNEGGTWNNNAVPSGSNVWFRATIQNIGAGATPSGVVHGVTFRVGGVTRSWSDNITASLAPGASRTQEANGGPAADGSNKYWDNAPSGGHAVEVLVDNSDLINESDETNNSFSTIINVSGGTGVLAFQADALIESMGIAIQFDRSNWQSNYTFLRARLAELGVRHLRGRVEPNNTGYRDIIIDLNSSFGIKFIFNPSNGDFSASTAANWINNSIGISSVWGFEGVNEPENFSGTDYLAVAYNTQLDYWNRFRVNGTTAEKALPIYGPSPTSPGEATNHRNYGLARSPTWPQICDGGGVHPYNSRRHPETTGWGSKLGDYNFGSFNYNMQVIAEVVGGTGRPCVFTEWGYNYSFHSNMDALANIYGLRGYLYSFANTLPSGAKGVKLYMFALQNPSSTSNWGLIDNLQGNNVHSLFFSMKNMIALLQDPGVSFTPGRLDYTLTGSLTDVYTRLFQKRTGVFYLTIWLGKEGWNPDTFARVTVPNQSVTLSFNAGQFDVDRNFPNDNTTWTSLGTNLTSVGLSVTERVQILRITP